LYAEDQIEVRIGNQADAGLLAGIVDEFGPPDVVIDDGSHMMRDITASFATLYPMVSRNGVYLVEDLHTAYWDEYEGGLKRPGTFIERCKELIDEINADHARGALAPTEFTRSTLSLHFYDSVVVFEKGRHTAKQAPRIGHDLSRVYNPNFLSNSVGEGYCSPAGSRAEVSSRMTTPLSRTCRPCREALVLSSGLDTRRARFTHQTGVFRSWLAYQPCATSAMTDDKPLSVDRHLSARRWSPAPWFVQRWSPSNAGPKRNRMFAPPIPIKCSV
jgi:hypothetical protein